MTTSQKSSTSSIVLNITIVINIVNINVESCKSIEPGVEAAKSRQAWANSTSCSRNDDRHFPKVLVLIILSAIVER